jgi:hypothetical protein
MEFESISPTFTKPINKKEANFIESYYDGSIPYIINIIWLRDIIKTYKNLINISLNAKKALLKIIFI